MTSHPVVRALLAALPALALAAPAASAAGVGASPPHCSPEQTTNCIVDGGGGDVTIANKVVKKGGTFTVTLAPDGGYGGLAGYAAQPSFTPVKAKGKAMQLKFVKCTGGKIVEVPNPEPFHAGTNVTGPRHCKYKVQKAGRGWQKATWSYTDRYGGLSAYSEDSVTGVAGDQMIVNGFVRGLPRNAGDKQGPGVQRMKVTAANKKERYSEKTDSNGFYAIAIKKEGRYDLFPKRRASDLDLRPSPTLTPGERKINVEEDEELDGQNFKLGRGDAYKVAFLKDGAKVTSAPANGATELGAEIEVLDLNDDPVAGKRLAVEINGGSLGPKAAVCLLSGGRTRLYPAGGLDARTGVVNPATEIRTNDLGKVILEVFPGTEAGQLAIKVGAKEPGPSDVPQTSTLDLVHPVGSSLSLEMSVAFGAPGGPAIKHQGQDPAPATDPQTAHFENVGWLADLLKIGTLGGWTYFPVRIEDGSKYGLIFYPLGAAGPTVDDQGFVSWDGEVYNEGQGKGLDPIARGDDMVPFATWAGGKRVQAYLRAEVRDIIYLGWPVDPSPASQCLSSG